MEQKIVKKQSPQYRAAKRKNSVSTTRNKTWKTQTFLNEMPREKMLKDIEGSWGTKRGAVTKAFKKAIKNAIESNRKILYPSTFALFKKLFSSFL